MPRLILHAGGSVRVLDCRAETLTFGRAEASNVRIDDPEVGDLHLRIEPSPEGFMLVDLATPRGTRVNGRLVKHQILRHGDEIAVGQATITFDDPTGLPPLPAAAVAAPPAPPPVRAPRGLQRKSREGPVVVAILIAAVIVIGLAVLVPKLTEPSPQDRAAEELFDQAQAREASDPAGAIALYEQVPAGSAEWHARAKDRIVRLREEIERKALMPSAEEQRDFEELQKFWKDNPSDTDAGIRKGEEFLAAHAESVTSAEVERRLATLRRLRTAARTAEVSAAENAADRHMGASDFAAAIRALDQVSERFRNDIDVFPRITAKRDAVAERAKGYFRTRSQEAEQFLKAGKKRDAKDLWYEVSRALGDGQVPEFADLAKAAAVNYESIKP